MPADRSLLVMPLFHVHGLMAGLLSPLAAGAAVVMPAAGRFAASTFWQDAVQYGATFYTGVGGGGAVRECYWRVVVRFGWEGAKSAGWRNRQQALRRRVSPPPAAAPPLGSIPGPHAHTRRLDHQSRLCRIAGPSQPSLPAPEPSTLCCAAVPTMHQILLSRADEDYPAASPPPLRAIRSCSSSLAPATLHKVEAAFKAPVLEVGWGGGGEAGGAGQGSRGWWGRAWGAGQEAGQEAGLGRGPAIGFFR